MSRTRLDLILKKLDIVLWKIRYPVVLRKTEPALLLVNLRFLIISDIFISLDDPFIKDVIHAMNIKYIEALIITIDDIHNLIMPIKVINYCWWIGLKVLCNFGCVSLNTVSLNQLKHDINKKQDLWNQIYRVVYRNN